MVRNSEIIIAQGIKIDNTYNNVLSYNTSEMLELVNNNRVAYANNYSFIRKETNTIQVGFNYSQVCNANYMAFQNKDYDNRWFFAFIRDIQYVDDGNVNIVFDIDVWSTYYSSLNIMDCFVEREHVNDDTIGLHTIPEDIATGDMVVEKIVEDYSLASDFFVGVLSDWFPISTGEQGAPGKQFNGITIYNGGVFGHQLLLFRVSATSTGQSPDLLALDLYIRITNHDGHIEDIKDMFIIPGAMIDETKLDLHDCHRQSGAFDQTTHFYTIRKTMNENGIVQDIPKVHSFNNISVKNNKLFVYPYNYILATNNNGNQNIYRYELFGNQENATFQIQMALQIGISGRCVPMNYNGQVDENDDESIPLGKYPTCCWSADSYVNWLTQQSVNLPTKFASAIIGVGANLATGNVGGAMLVGAGAVATTIGDLNMAQLKPNIEGGGNTSDVVYSAERNTITFKCMRPKLENIRIIDDYFTRFGYKINETKRPNLTGRQYWNYIKIGAGDRFASGDIQSKYLDEINNIAQKGVTIWHDHDSIGNFDLDNAIV